MHKTGAYRKRYRHVITECRIQFVSIFFYLEVFNSNGCRCTYRGARNWLEIVFGREREKKECKMYLNYDTAKMPFYHWAKLIKTNDFGK